MVNFYKVIPETVEASRADQTPPARTLFYASDSDRLYRGDGATVGGKIIRLPSAAIDVAADSVLLGNIAGGNQPAQELTATQIRALLSLTDGDALTVTAAGSTTARALADRFGPVANVLDFGAAGDGVVDDTTAIQAALDSGAAAVGIPEQTFRITASLNMHTKQALVGLGNAWNCEIAGDEVTGGLIVPNPDPDPDPYAAMPNVDIHNLYLTGACDYGIFMRYCQNSRVSNINFSFPDTVIDFLNAAGCWNLKAAHLWGYCLPGPRSFLYLGADMHSLQVFDAYSVAATEYMVLSRFADSGGFTGGSTSQRFVGCTSQRNRIGFSFEHGSAITIDDAYFESTEIPVELGLRGGTTRVGDFTGNGLRMGTTAGTATTAGALAGNSDGLLHLNKCRDVTIIGSPSSEMGGGGIYAKLYDARAVKFIGGCGGNNILKDIWDYVVVDYQGEHSNTVFADAAGVDGDTVLEATRVSTVYAERNQYRLTTIHPTTGADEHTLGQFAQLLPDPDFAFSLNRYLVASPATKQPVAQLERASDSATADFYLDAGVLKKTDDDTTVESWLTATTATGTRWYDQTDTTGATYVAPPGADEQPTFTLAGIDGQYCWTYGDGGKSAADSSGWVLTGYGATGAITLYLVAEHVDDTDNDDYLLGSNTGGAQLAIEFGNGVNKYGAGMGGNPGSGTVVDGTGAVVLEVWIDGIDNGSDKFDTNFRANKDDANDYQGQTANAAGTVPTELHLGGRGIDDPGNYYNYHGDNTEAFGWLGPLSKANRDTVSQAAMDQYSIT